MCHMFMNLWIYVCMYPGKSTGVGCHCLLHMYVSIYLSIYISVNIHNHTNIYFVSAQWICYSVAQSCSAFCDPMDCSMPGFYVLHYLPEFAQALMHWVDDAVQPSHSQWIGIALLITVFFIVFFWVHNYSHCSLSSFGKDHFWIFVTFVVVLFILVFF